MTTLREYGNRRDPKATPEPFGSGERGDEPIFVVQRHDARRLHYDFRLERDGALASWAVPKGIPLEPGQRALAVHVEDHPLDYADFEGEIPKGNYGAGTVEIWDRGTYELVEEKKDGGLTVRLHGEKLHGTWTLVPAKLDGDPKNWLLLRKREDGAGAEQPRGRRRHKPMLATLAKDLPKGGDWLYEIKWDGYRAIAYVYGGEAQFVSRNDNDLTPRFPTVRRALERAVKTPDCVLDGEICALDDHGRATFSAMQQGKPDTRYIYVVFDVLEVEGEPVINLPLVERRERLEALLDRRKADVQISEAFEDGEGLYEAAKEQAYEGVIAKRPDSRYEPGRRTSQWLKVKTHSRQEFVIAGYTKGQGRRAGSFGSLVLGTYEGGELRYVGNVGTGFTDGEIGRLLKVLTPLERPDRPFAEVPKMPKVRKGDVAWVEPKLVAEVEFVEWTHDGHLRAPSYQGLREDKAPEQVHREEPLPKDRPFTMKRYPDGWKGKFFFQKDAPTHMPDWIKRVEIEVTTRDSPRQRRRIQAPVVNDDLSLLWMINMGCIDCNTWYSRIEKPERPDFVLFDLDPSPDVGFPETIQVALLVKQALDALGLVSFAKTSGSEGIHVLVPIDRRSTFADTRRFAEIVAGAIARAHPGLATTEWAKAKRRGVLIDANQNGEGKTIASVYSVRPKPGAPVSTPLCWEEVDESLDPAAFTMDVVIDRVNAEGDLFEGVLTTKQSLSRALKALQ